MLFKKLFQLKYISSAMNEIKCLDDAIALLSAIPTGNRYEKMEKKSIEACFAEMLTSKNVLDVRAILIDRFGDDFGKLNNFMEIMDSYLIDISLRDVKNLQQALIVCEEVPHKIIPCDLYGEEWRETIYDRKAVSKAIEIIDNMFDFANGFEGALSVLDEVVENMNKHSAFRASFSLTDKAIDIVMGYIITLDQVDLLYETYRRCGCISITAFSRIQNKYVEIGSNIVNRHKTVDELIELFSKIPNLQKNLYDYIVAKINEVGLSMTFDSLMTEKLVEYDKKLPDCPFKNAIRDELVKRLDTTKS